MSRASGTLCELQAYLIARYPFDSGRVCSYFSVSPVQVERSVFVSAEELRMDETLKVVQAASKKATDVVPEVLQAWWDQPAVGCAPWIKRG